MSGAVQWAGPGGSHVTKRVESEGNAIDRHGLRRGTVDEVSLGRGGVGGAWKVEETPPGARGAGRVARRGDAARELWAPRGAGVEVTAGDGLRAGAPRG